MTLESRERGAGTGLAVKLSLIRESVSRDLVLLVDLQCNALAWLSVLFDCIIISECIIFFSSSNEKKKTSVR